MWWLPESGLLQLSAFLCSTAGITAGRTISLTLPDLLQNFDDVLVPVDHVSRSPNDTYYVDAETVGSWWPCWLDASTHAASRSTLLMLIVCNVPVCCPVRCYSSSSPLLGGC